MPPFASIIDGLFRPYIVDIVIRNIDGMGEGGGRVVRWCWVSFQCRGVLLILSRVGPTALAVGAGEGCLDIFFSRPSFLFSLSLSLGDGPIKTEILSQRVVKPKTTNQPRHGGNRLLFFAQCSHIV